MELKPIYSISLEESKGQHFYSINGKNLLLPSSTTILGRVISKPILVPWAAKMTGSYIKNYLEKIGAAISDGQGMARLISRTLKKKQIEKLIRRAKRQYKYEREKAADLGTRVHQYIDDITKGIEHAPKKDTDTAIQNWKEWKEETETNILQGDTKIASLEYGFAGSLDAVAKGSSGLFEIIDYKTSNYTDVTHALQVSSYAVAFKETFGLDYLPHTRVIRFDRSSRKWEERKVKNTEKAWNAFLLCLQLYHALGEDHFEITHSNNKAVANEKIKMHKRKRRQ